MAAYSGGGLWIADKKISDYRLENCGLQIHCVAAFGGGGLGIADKKISDYRFTAWLPSAVENCGLQIGRL